MGVAILAGKVPRAKAEHSIAVAVCTRSVAAANYRDKPMSARGDDHARDTKRVEQLCEALMQRVANARHGEVERERALSARGKYDGI